MPVNHDEKGLHVYQAVRAKTEYCGTREGTILGIKPGFALVEFPWGCLGSHQESIALENIEPRHVR